MPRSNGYMPNVAEATSLRKQSPRSSGTSGHSVADAIRERRIEDPERLLMRTDRNPGRSWAASPVAGHRRRRGSYSRSDRQPSACRGWRPRTGVFDDARTHGTTPGRDDEDRAVLVEPADAREESRMNESDPKFRLGTISDGGASPSSETRDIGQEIETRRIRPQEGSETPGCRPDGTSKVRAMMRYHGARHTTKTHRGLAPPIPDFHARPSGRRGESPKTWNER